MASSAASRPSSEEKFQPQLGLVLIAKQEKFSVRWTRLALLPVRGVVDEQLREGRDVLPAPPPASDRQTRLTGEGNTALAPQASLSPFCLLQAVYTNTIDNQTTLSASVLLPGQDVVGALLVNDGRQDLWLLARGLTPSGLSRRERDELGASLDS